MEKVASFGAGSDVTVPSLMSIMSVIITFKYDITCRYLILLSLCAFFVLEKKSQ